MQEECGDASGIAVVLGELRSEYFQIRKAEMLMQRHRDKWMRSVEQWLDNQGRAMRLPSPDASHGFQRKGARPRRRPAAPVHPQVAHPQVAHQQVAQLQLEAPQIALQQVTQLGPQRPCPQPVPVVADELDPNLDTPQASETAEVLPPIKQQVASPRVLSKPPQAVDLKEDHAADRTPRRSAASRASRISTMKPEEVAQAEAQGKRMSKTHSAVVVPAERRRARARKWKALQPDPESECGSMKCIVESPIFDSACAIMIVLNSVIIGVEVNEQSKGNLEESTFLMISGYTCSLFFLVELIMRMYVQGKGYFCDGHRGWNFFDLALVALSIVDFMVVVATGGSTSSIGTGMKTVKMLRIVRVFRVFRFFQQLSLLALMIADSTANLVWALILLGLIIFVFAIIFTSEAATFIQDHGGDNANESEVRSVDQWFGSLTQTMYTLIQSMLGGVSWGVCSDALAHIGSHWCGVFIFYVAFTILAVMNVVTGVFVDNAVETARTTRDFLIAKEMELKEKYACEMRDLFIEMDKDGSGTVGLEEINEYLEDPRVKAFFNTLGLDTNDTERLFKLIDDDGSGDVDVGEFLDGCLRLKGQARSLDVYAIMHDMKSLENKVDDLIVVMRRQAESGFAQAPPPCSQLQYSQPPQAPRESQSSRSSHWTAGPAQAPAPSRTPQVVTVTTTATATLV